MAGGRPARAGALASGRRAGVVGTRPSSALWARRAGGRRLGGGPPSGRAGGRPLPWPWRSGRRCGAPPRPVRGSAWRSGPCPWPHPWPPRADVPAAARAGRATSASWAAARASRAFLTLRFAAASRRSAATWASSSACLAFAAFELTLDARSAGRSWPAACRTSWSTTAAASAAPRWTVSPIRTAIGSRLVCCWYWSRTIWPAVACWASSAACPRTTAALAAARSALAFFSLAAIATSWPWRPRALSGSAPLLAGQVEPGLGLVHGDCRPGSGHGWIR